MKPLRVLQTVASINEATGGPAVSVTKLAASLTRDGQDCRVLALDYPELGPPCGAGSARVHLHPASGVARRFAAFSLDYRRLATAFAAESDVVHNHGIWLYPNRAARVAAQCADRPLVISPRGMLEPWTLAHGRVKKAVAWRLYERANLRAAAGFHATSHDEARSIRARGIRAPIAVIPNGVDPMPSAVDRHASMPSAASRVLFLSRLHRKKGVELLLDAWNVIARERPDARLTIAGSDLGSGYAATLVARASDSGISDSVTFAGPLSGDTKTAAFQSADVFVLPSHSENFGIVVAEALAHGLPVITTTATPWQMLDEEQCGWWIAPTTSALVEALRAALDLTVERRRNIDTHARALVRERFSWTAVASDMLAFYRWIVEERARPSLAPAFLAD